jgi:uncharacterized protein
MIKEIFLFLLIFLLMKTSLKFIRAIKGSLLLDVIRNVLFFIPFILPALYYGLPSFELRGGLGFYAISILAALIALCIKYQEFKPYMNKSFYKLLPALSFKHFIIMEISLIGSAVFEEIFYRSFVPSSIFLIGMLLSGFLFSFAHYIQDYTRNFFDTKTYLILFGLSLVWYTSYIFTGSILPAIIGHFIYNLPSMIITAVHYSISRKEKKDQAPVIKGEYHYE